MKKVLIISHPFPPLQAVGSQRFYRLAKYFPKYGWEPVVLTVKRAGKPPNGIKVIETDYKDIVSTIKSKIGFNPKKVFYKQLDIEVSKNFNHLTWKSKIIKFLKEVINFPDDRKRWYRFALKSASECLDKEMIDIIISTSFPVTSHLIARKLKQKYKIPWIADLRDLWTQNPYIDKFSLIKYFERRLEVKTLSNADSLVTVTHPWINTLKELHKNKKIFCVTNGYDDDDFPEITTTLTEKFTITYAGTLYNGKRDPSLLFKILAQLIKEKRVTKELIEIRLYGPKEDWIVEKVKKNNLEDIVNFHGLVPREEVLKNLRESQVLLLLVWNSKNEEGFCPAKIYEYFGSRRPIIAMGWPGSVVKNLLEKTNTGKFADNIDNVRYILLEYYQEFIKYGEVKCRSNRNIENYTYNSITKTYAEILNKLVLK